MSNDEIQIKGCRQNNLKNINLKLPINNFISICGPSGSGKSSLAFETLYSEGQRQYIECLSNYIKQFLQMMDKPDVDEISGLPPALALEQKNNVKNSRSTVDTLTEINDHLRSLFECAGNSYCPTHNEKLQSWSPVLAAKYLLKNWPNRRIYITVYLPHLSQVLLKQAQKCGISKALTTTGEVFSLQKINSKKEKALWLIVDRIQVKNNSISRITEALSTAYKIYRKIFPLKKDVKSLVVDTSFNQLVFTEKESCPQCDYTLTKKRGILLNPNSPAGACENCKGFGKILEVSKSKVIPNDTLTLKKNAVSVLKMPSFSKQKTEFTKFCNIKKISIDRCWKDLSQTHQSLVWNWTLKLFEKLEKKKHRMFIRILLSRYKSPVLCLSCKGSRLRKEASHIKINGKNMQDLSKLSLEELHSFIKKDLNFSKEEKAASKDVLKALQDRTLLCLEIGLGYLHLSRLSKTLSGGELQRINLVKQISGGLSDALYVLDEPSVGLHPNDIDNLIRILKKLKNNDNTLIVVEHEAKILKASDHIVEIGPKSGTFGGEVLFSGSLKSFVKNKKSVTSAFLKEKTPFPVKERVTNLKTHKYILKLTGCSGHNLKNITLKVPLRRLTAICGVSGSGKSSLVGQTLYPALCQSLKLDVKDLPPPLPFKKLSGHESLKNVLYIDQKISRHSEKTFPVTYIKVFGHIRILLANTSEAIKRNMTPGHFSLNSPLGKCPECAGYGYKNIDMCFMDDIKVKYELCNGDRFK